MDRLQLCFCERRDAESRKEVKLCGLSIDEAACGQKEMRTDEGLERRSGSSRDQHRDEARAMAESSEPSACFSALITLSAGGVGPLSNWVKTRGKLSTRSSEEGADVASRPNTSSRPLHLLSFALTIPGSRVSPSGLPLHVTHSSALNGLLRAISAIPEVTELANSGQDGSPRRVSYFRPINKLASFGRDALEISPSLPAPESRQEGCRY